jgi:hypothetical protein
MSTILRTCSTCASWAVQIYGTQNKIGVIEAPCAVHKDARTGGDKCGEWQPSVKQETT